MISSYSDPGLQRMQLVPVISNHPHVCDRKLMHQHGWNPNFPKRSCLALVLQSSSARAEGSYYTERLFRSLKDPSILTGRPSHEELEVSIDDNHIDEYGNAVMALSFCRLRQRNTRLEIAEIAEMGQIKLDSSQLVHIA
jgi:hypothetical protein